MEHLLSPGIKAAIRIRSYRQRPDDDGHIASVDECARIFKTIVDWSRIGNIKEEPSHHNLWLNQWRRGRVYNLCYSLLDQFYFGRLHHILGPDVVVADFTERGSNGSIYLTTAALERYISAWRSRIEGLDDAYKKERVQSQCLLMLEQSYLVLHHLDWFLDWLYTDRWADDEPLGRTHLACVLLHETFVQACAHVFDATTDVWDGFYVRSKAPWLKRKMESEGWCPCTIARLSDLRSMDVLVYAYNVGTQRANADGRHRKCDQTACLAENTQGDSGMKHVNYGCDCFIVEAPTDDIDRIRQNGGNPVLKIGTDDGYKLSLYARSAGDSNAGVRYVYISHVWTDGLGSRSSNIIAQCQLTRIADRLGRLEAKERCGELNIWLDSLCIPVPSQSPGEVKSRTEHEHEAYTKAYAVIMMDADTMSMRRNVSPAEMGMRLYLSSCFAQLRTCQEGALNPRLFIMTLDSIVDIDEILRNLENESEVTNPLQRDLLRTLTQRIKICISRS